MALDIGPCLATRSPDAIVVNMADESEDVLPPPDQPVLPGSQSVPGDLKSSLDPRIPQSTSCTDAIEGWAPSFTLDTESEEKRVAALGTAMEASESKQNGVKSLVDAWVAFRGVSWRGDKGLVDLKSKNAGWARLGAEVEGLSGVGDIWGEGGVPRVGVGPAAGGGESVLVMSVEA